MSHHSSARIVVTIALITLFGSFPVVAAQSREVAIIYPDLDEPYRAVFSSIIEGIQERITSGTKLIPLGNPADAAQSAKSINQDKISVIIALGRTGLAASEPWLGRIPVVVGALLLEPDEKEKGMAGISLAADPELLLTRLTQLAPSVKRVHVVYNPKSSGWLIRIAQASAAKLNLKLYSYESDDIKNSALIYRDILDKSRPGTDAIWLLPDPVAVDNRIILPLLLRGAWNNNLLLFSSNPAHVKRGALFAMYPDNRLMGVSLAKMAESYANENAADMENKVVTLKDLQSAINIRTTEHIGLTLSNAERKEYSLVFPAP